MSDNIEELEQQVLAHLDDGLSMSLGLTTTDSEYSISFIKEKLILCSTFQERLSDIMMKLTRVSIEATRMGFAAKQRLDLRYNERKSSQDYQDQPREKKTVWLQSAIKDQQEAAERWNALRRVVSEVKDAIGERAQTMKRLDSDLRLHSKLLEMVPPEGRGATSPGSYTGSHAGEIEL